MAYKTVPGVILLLLAVTVKNDYLVSVVPSFERLGPRVVSSLQFVAVISRHGNRGAHKDISMDPYPLEEPKYWPYGKGALTPLGRVQMFRLGEKLRALYDGYLNSTFYPEEIRAVSSPTERTLMSGQALLAGLYPPQGFQVWNKDIPWQPVPLYSNSPDNAHDITKCSKFLLEFVKQKEIFYEKYASNLTEILDYYNKVTGSNSSNRFMWYIWDKLISEYTAKKLSEQKERRK